MAASSGDDIPTQLAKVLGYKRRQTQTDTDRHRKTQTDPLLNVNFNVRMRISTSEKSFLGAFRRVDLPLARGEKLGGESPP